MTAPSSLAQLIALVRRLDPLLSLAVSAAERFHGAPGVDPFRGLYVDAETARRLFDGDRVVPHREAAPLSVLSEPSRLTTLAERFGLDEFDAQVLLLAAAVDLDARYERLFAYLQDDVTRRRPTIDLALALLGRDDDDRLARRLAFAPDAPLVINGLVEILPESNGAFMSRALRVDDSIVGYLAGDDALDRRLVAASVSWLDEDGEETPADPSLLRAIQASNGLQCHGGCAVAQREAVGQAMAQLGKRVLELDLNGLLARADLAPLALVLVREARLRNAALLVTNAGTRRPETESARQTIGAVLRASGISIIVSGPTAVAPWADSGPGAGPALAALPFPDSDFDTRRAAWERATRDVAAITNAELDDLAGRFTLSPSRIRRTVAIAARAALTRAAQSPELDAEATASDLLAALRSQTTPELQYLSRRIEPRAGWADLILPPDASAQLNEICAHARRRHQVFDDWGFGRAATPGRGLTVLFAGPSGTGKTLAAEVLATALGLDLYRIDLSRIVSKYIGETERNLDRVFNAAAAVQGLLLFDEADALFGRRSEVSDAHDRYANIEVGYLLQKMEEFDGIAILATNLHRNIDDAFTRRMQFSVDFPFPDEAQRYLIWQRHIPAKAPVAEDVDLEFLSRQFRLSGGSIRNITFAAAVMASDQHAPIGMRHLVRATRRELQKAGRSCHEAEFGRFYEEALAS